MPSHRLGFLPQESELAVVVLSSNALATHSTYRIHLIQSARFGVETGVRSSLDGWILFPLNLQSQFGGTDTTSSQNTPTIQTRFLAQPDISIFPLLSLADICPLLLLSRTPRVTDLLHGRSTASIANLATRRTTVTDLEQI